MIQIDGSMGEGGGQILRTSVALSLVHQIPVDITNIRAGRPRPGLMRAHLAAIKAAAEISQARLEGDRLHSQHLVFRPGPVLPGTYLFDVGSAGSTTLILQAILPPLMVAHAPSTITLRGGTHNPWAPPYDYLERVLAPAMEQMGVGLNFRLKHYGFHPAGGGEFTVKVNPAPSLKPIQIIHRGPIRSHRARAILSALPDHIAQRELDVVAEELGWPANELQMERVENPSGPGNVLMLEIKSEGLTEIITGFGRRGVPAERVAQMAAQEALDYLAAEVPVGSHLADQLLVPLSMSGGMFRTLTPSSHTQTNLDVIGHFKQSDALSCRQVGEHVWEVARVIAV